MNQMDLFNVPVSRRDDPVSSKEAEKEINLTGSRLTQAEIIFNFVKEFPGKTSGELTALINHMDRYQVSRRLSDLWNTGRVSKGKARICKEMGRTSLTWYVNSHSA